MPAEQSAVSKGVPLKLDFQVQQVLSLIDAKLLFLAAGLQPAAALGNAIGVMFGWSFYPLYVLRKLSMGNYTLLSIDQLFSVYLSIAQHCSALLSIAQHCSALLN